MEKIYICLDFADFAKEIYKENPDYVYCYTGDCHQVFKNFCIKLRKPYFKFLFFYRRKIVFKVDWQNKILLSTLEHEREANRLCNLYKKYNPRAISKVVYMEMKNVNQS